MHYPNNSYRLRKEIQNIVGHPLNKKEPLLQIQKLHTQSSNEQFVQVHLNATTKQRKSTARRKVGRQSSSSIDVHQGRSGARWTLLEPMDLNERELILRNHQEGEFIQHYTNLDGLRVQFQTFFLVDQEFLNILTLVTLQLNHLTHLIVGDDGAIAG